MLLMKVAEAKKQNPASHKQRKKKKRKRAISVKPPQY